MEKEDTIDSDCDLLGFASPVYGGHPAKIMLDFIERSKRLSVEVPAFTMLCPCSTMGYWGSREVFMDALSSKNIRVIVASGFLGNPSHPVVVGSIRRVSPFIKSMFDGIGRPDEVDAAEIRDIAEKLLTVFEDYANGRKIKKPRYSKIKRWVSKVVRARELALIKVTPLMVYQDKCVQCGLCQKECPVGALSLNPFPVQDRNKCFACQKCVNLCPKEALYLKGMEQIGRYRGKKPAAVESLKQDNSRGKGALRHRKPILLRFMSTGISMVIAIMLKGISDKLLVHGAASEKIKY